jgi:putative membrane protein
MACSACHATYWRVSRAAIIDLRTSAKTTHRCLIQSRRRSRKRIAPRERIGFLALCSRLMKLIVRWLLLAAALLLVAHLYPGVEVKSFTGAMVAALVIGLFNALLRPILVLLTLPVTVLTVGLFLFVINAVMFYAAAGVLGNDFNVSGFSAALIGSLIYSLCGMVIDVAMERIFPAR